MVRSSLLAASALSALFLGHAAQAQEPLKIGAVLSLSGSFAQPSKDMQDAMQLALDQRSGKIAGRPVSLIVRDDQGKPELAVEAVNRLTRSERVDFVTGAGLSNIMMAVHRPVTSSETFLIGTNAGPAPLAGKDCSPYFFSASYQNDQNAEAMGEYLAKKGVADVFILAPNYQAGKDLLSGFKRTFNGKIAGEIYTPLQQTDFSAEISRVRAANPAAVFVFYPGAWGVQWVKQYSQAGLDKTIPLYSAFTLDEVSIQAIGDAALGMYSSSHWVGDIDNPTNARFVSEYRAKYGRQPSGYAAQGYDSIQLIASAVEAVKGDLSSKDETRKALAKADFPSVRGPFKYNTNHFPVQNYYLTRVEKKGDELALVTVGKALDQAKDVYAAECPLK